MFLRATNHVDSLDLDEVSSYVTGMLIQIVSPTVASYAWSDHVAMYSNSQFKFFEWIIVRPMVKTTWVIIHHCMNMCRKRW